MQLLARNSSLAEECNNKLTKAATTTPSSWSSKNSNFIVTAASEAYWKSLTLTSDRLAGRVAFIGRDWRSLSFGGDWGSFIPSASQFLILQQDQIAIIIMFIMKYFVKTCTVERSSMPNPMHRNKLKNQLRNRSINISSSSRTASRRRHFLSPRGFTKVIHTQWWNPTNAASIHVYHALIHMKDFSHQIES